MALSDVIKKIEDWPRSTKVAAGVAGAAVASAIAIFTVMNNQPEYRPAPESAAKAAVTSTQTVPSPAALQPSPAPVPAKTPPLDPTKTPVPSPTVEKPTPTSTLVPTPIATPTPDASDYYVFLNPGGVLDDGKGTITFYASYPFNKNTAGARHAFNKEAFYLEYLRKEGVITSEQKNAYLNNEFIKVPLVSISNATYKLYQTQGYNANIPGLNENSERYLFHYADKSLDYGESVSNVDDLLTRSDQGYMMISDGKISVSGVDNQGNTTTVQVEGVGAKELLDYWLSQNKITVQQRNQYGQTGQIQLSLKDGLDLFNFAQSSDAGANFGIDKETQDKIVNELLPLFKFGD